MRKVALFSSMLICCLWGMAAPVWDIYLQKLRTIDVASVASVDSAIFVDENSMVGIGTINPARLLHLYGTDTTTSDGWNTQTNGIALDGVPDADKSVSWMEGGVNKWEAQTYRGEEAEFWYLYSCEAKANALTVSRSGRVGVSQRSNIIDYPASKMAGTGPNDLNLSGSYTKNYVAVYEIVVTDTGVSADSMAWRKSRDSGVTYGSYTAFAASATPVLLDNGISVSFDSTTGHVVGDLWRFVGFAQLPPATLSVSPAQFQEVLLAADYTNPVFVDITASANATELDSDTDILKDTSAAVYVGSINKYDELYINMRNVAVGLTPVLEYYNGVSWVVMGASQDLYDGTSGGTKSGAIVFTPALMAGWQLSDMGYGEELYWLRIRTSTNPTTSPMAYSISKHGNMRFAVYSAYNDSQPSMFIDSRGRTSIGGGNITNGNLLQINDKLTGAITTLPNNSLIEADSEDTNRTDINLRLAEDCSSGADYNIYKSRGTLSAPSNMVYGDEIGCYMYSGYYGGAWGVVGCMQSLYTGDGTTAKSDLVFHLAGGSSMEERMRITSEGDVGIGTDTPRARLQVAPTETSVTSTAAVFEVDASDSLASEAIVRLSESSAGGKAVLGLVKSRGDLATPANLVNGDYVGDVAFRGFANSLWGNLAYVGCQYVGDGSTSSGDLLLTTATSGSLVERMRVNYAGNVGVGVTSPGARLHISGTSVPGTITSLSSAAVLKVDSQDSTVAGTDLRLSETSVGSASLNFMKTRGTLESPANAALNDVTGAINFKARANGSMGNMARMCGLYTGDGTTPNGVLAFHTTQSGVDSERVRISNTGNVGIGTTTPTSKLHVVGLPEYSNNGAAVAAGLTVGAFYHTNGTVKVVIP